MPEIPAGTPITLAARGVTRERKQPQTAPEWLETTLRVRGRT